MRKKYNISMVFIAIAEYGYDRLKKIEIYPNQMLVEIFSVLNFIIAVVE